MSNEIKEILDKLRSDDYYEKEYQKSIYYERDLKKLKDYIINLQQENDNKYWKIKKLNEQLNDLTDDWISRGKKIEDLQQENERLKTENALVSDRNNDYRRTKEYYKSIVEKSTEYIEHSWWLRTEVVYDTSKDLKDWEVKELYDILQGGKDDNEKKEEGK